MRYLNIILFGFIVGIFGAVSADDNKSELVNSDDANSNSDLTIRGRRLTKKRKKTKDGLATPAKSQKVLEEFLDLEGKWRENQYYRKGLGDMLYELGMPWWKRLYATQTNWENEQTIVQHRNNEFKIYGFKGPQAEVYSYTLMADNSTVSAVGMGDFGGGHLNARAFVEISGAQQGREGEGEEKDNEQEDVVRGGAMGGTLVAHLTNRETGILEMVQKRSRTKGSKMMVEETVHVPSGTVMRSVYFKQ